MRPTINFDMDGTIADLYGVDNWLEYLLNTDVTPYAIAKPLVRMSSLARILNRLQKQGYKIAVISWLAKIDNDVYHAEVEKVKREWLKKHLPSVHFDEINIVSYGTPKQNYARTEHDILFDDEKQNRDNWTGCAYDVNNIIEILKSLK